MFLSGIKSRTQQGPIFPVSRRVLAHSTGRRPAIHEMKSPGSARHRRQMTICFRAERIARTIFPRRADGAGINRSQQGQNRARDSANDSQASYRRPRRPRGAFYVGRQHSGNSGHALFEIPVGIPHLNQVPKPGALQARFRWSILSPTAITIILYRVICKYFSATD
jgi:hypothetical protein